MVTLILILSIGLQFGAAGMAIWMALSQEGARRWGWYLISGALVLMGTRRLVGLAGLFENLERAHAVLIMESIALVISILMVSGVWQMGWIFGRMRDALLKQQQLVEIVENTTEMVVSFGPNYGIAYMNQEARRVFGLETARDETVYGLKVQDLLTEETAAHLLTEMLPTVQRMGRCAADGRIRVRASGGSMEVAQVLVAHPQVEGKIPRFTLLMTDLTQRKAKEAELLRNAEMRDQLLAILGHDLRGPLSSCLKTLELLRQDHAAGRLERLHDDLTSVQSALGGCYQLADNLLKWVSLQFDQMEVRLRDHALEPFVSQALGAMESGIAEKGLAVEVEIEAGLRVLADRDILEIVLRNLLSNAVKFSPLGGKVRICGRLQGDLVEVRIADEGAGLSAEDATHMEQGTSPERRLGSKGERGAGLGIGLCGRLLEKLREQAPRTQLKVLSAPHHGAEIGLYFESGDC